MAAYFIVVKIYLGLSKSGLDVPVSSKAMIGHTARSTVKTTIFITLCVSYSQSNEC